MYKDIHVPIKKPGGIINDSFLCGGVMCVHIVFYFQTFPQHTCNIFLREGKPSKGSQMVAQGSQRVIPFNFP